MPRPYTFTSHSSGQTIASADINALQDAVAAIDAAGTNFSAYAPAGALTIQDEGSSLATAASALNFVGSGVTVSGTGATKTISVPGLSSTSSPAGYHVYNVRDWITSGYGDDEVDQSASFLQAVTDLNASFMNDDDKPILYCPPGIVRVREIDLGAGDTRAVKSMPLLIGGHGAATQIRYNGAGGTGSYIFKMPTTTNGGSYDRSGFAHLQLRGWNRIDNTTNTISQNNQRTCAESGIVFGNSARTVLAKGLDFDFIFHSMGFREFLGDAIDLRGAYNIVQFYAHRPRFDSVGGYCFHLPDMSTDAEHRPVVIREITIDNQNNQNLAGFVPDRSMYQDDVLFAHAAYATANGLTYDRWCKGIVCHENSKGFVISIGPGRIEFNDALVVDGSYRSWCNDKTPSGNEGGMWRFEGLEGYSQGNDMASVLRMRSTRVGYYFSGDCDISNTQHVFYQTTPTGLHTLPNGRTGMATFHARENVEMQGTRINGQLIEHRDVMDTTVETHYRDGDLCFIRAGSLATGVGVRALKQVGGTTGFGSPAFSSIARLTAAAMTSGSTTLSSPTEITAVTSESGTDNAWRFPIGAAIRVVGAGVAGADLLANVVDFNTTTQTYVLSVAASTTVTAKSVYFQNPEFVQWGEYYLSVASKPTRTDLPVGTKARNSAPAEAGTAPNKYVVIGWVYTAGGWLDQRTLTGN